MRIIKWILIALFAVLLCPILFIYSMKIHNHYVDKINSKAGIEFQGFVEINGLRQWICVRGENLDNPIILFLHGGPGSPESAMAAKKYQGKLEDNFIMVHWEQRSTCKSYSTELQDKKLVFDDFVNDAITLTEYLLKQYHQEKIYLIGHSFGSLVGIEAISRRPDLYYAYIGLGQFVNSVDQENISREFVIEWAKKEGNQKVVQELESIGIAPYRNTKDDIFIERQYLMRSSGWTGKNYSVNKLIRDALFCPYYSCTDYLKAYHGAMYSLDQLLNEDYWSIALDQTHLSFSIPVYFICGLQDFNTPTQLVEKYYSAISAPGKELVLIEGCGHMVNFEEPGRFNDEVIRLFNK
jgi:pimeloyl-ACP methyl ester carboxylesterase